jgi:hypothetical protein
MPKTDSRSFVATIAARRRRPRRICRQPTGQTKSCCARSKRLDAAISSVREKHSAGMTMDELSARAGTTQGAFLHPHPTEGLPEVAAANRGPESSSEPFETRRYRE